MQKVVLQVNNEGDFMNTLRKLKKTWISSAHQGFVYGKMASNTLAAYRLAAQKGADMIETDARMTKDGILIANHDPEVRGYDEQGMPVCYTISETAYSAIRSVHLTKEKGTQDFVPTLEEVLHLAYFTGMCINIDLKDGIRYAAKIAQLVVNTGMRGRTVYATNGAGAAAIHLILSVDPEAKFIDTKANYTKEALASVVDYPSKCYVYTGDFSDENIAEIRESGCMLAAISLNRENAQAAFRHHPDMAEYPHTSDFEEIDHEILTSFLGNSLV